MKLKRFEFPKDYHTLLKLTIESYQYQHNPEWGVPHSLPDLLEPQYKALRSVYPYLRLLARFDQRLQAVLGGALAYADTSNGPTPAGVALLMRLYEYPRFELGNVGVVPDWRRRGIARQMVETCIQQARAAEGDALELNVIDGNTPPQMLYEQLGFETLYYADELTHYEPMVPLIPRLPAGYTTQRIRFGEGGPQEALSQRLGFPAQPGRYTFLPGLRWLAWLVFARSTMGWWGQAVYDPQQTLVAVMSVMFQPGTNTAHFLLDPDHAPLAEILLQHLLHRSATHYFGTPLALTLVQSVWGAVARRLGFVHEFVHRRMALSLTTEGVQ